MAGVKNALKCHTPLKLAFGSASISLGSRRPGISDLCSQWRLGVGEQRPILSTMPRVARSQTVVEALREDLEDPATQERD